VNAKPIEIIQRDLY